MGPSSARGKLIRRSAALAITATTALTAAITPPLATGAESGGAAAVFWSNTSASVISSAKLDGSGGADLAFSGTTVSSPAGTAIDALAGEIYWANAGNETISWARLNGPGGTLNIGSATISHPHGLAIDPAISKRVYWANSAGGSGNGGSIAYANLSNAATPGGGDLITGTGVSSPDAVVVDPADGRIFWANSTGAGPESDGSIWSARLDGTDATELPIAGAATVAAPSGLSLDPNTATLYWTNPTTSGTGSISFWNLDTDTGGQLVTTADINRPEGVAIDPVTGTLYWANAGDDTIAHARLDGSGGGSLNTTGATTASPSFPVLVVPPAPQSAPAVTGAGTIGTALTCSQATWAADIPSAFYYRVARNISWQWSRDGVDVAGAASTSFTPAQAGSYTCRELGKNHAGTTIQTSSPLIVSAAPSAATGTASSVDPTGAVLNGLLTPQYATTRYHFEYGITTAYGSRAPAADVSVAADGKTHAVSVRIGGLMPDRVYHFRLVATNFNGTSYGADRTLSTTFRPVASTGAASRVSDERADLHGSVNPENLATRYYFEYGRTPAYGLRAPGADASAGSGAANHSISVRVSGLAAGRTYHFRLVAVNAAGTSYGADRSFRTLTQPRALVSGRVLTIGGSLRLTLRCRGAATQHCPILVSVSTRRPGPRGSRTVIIARHRYELAAGRRRNVSLPLNRTGRMLRARSHHLHAGVTVTTRSHGHTRTLRRARVTFGWNPPRVTALGVIGWRGGDRAGVRLRCLAPHAPGCTGTAELTTHELLAADGRTITGVSATNSPRSRLVTLARLRYHETAGATRVFTTRLTRAGRTLRHRFTNVPARLTIFINHKGYKLVAAHRAVTLRRSRALGASAGPATAGQ